MRNIGISLEVVKQSIQALASDTSILRGNRGLPAVHGYPDIIPDKVMNIGNYHLKMDLYQQAEMLKNIADAIDYEGSSEDL